MFQRSFPIFLLVFEEIPGVILMHHRAVAEDFYKDLDFPHVEKSISTSKVVELAIYLRLAACAFAACK